MMNDMFLVYFRSDVYILEQNRIITMFLSGIQWCLRRKIKLTGLYLESFKLKYVVLRTEELICFLKEIGVEIPLDLVADIRVTLRGRLKLNFQDRFLLRKGTDITYSSANYVNHFGLLLRSGTLAL